MGALNYEKGYYSLLNTFKSISHLEIKLKIYGKGDSFKDKNKNIQYFGSYKLDQIKDIFDGIDILIMPSKSIDTFGFTVLEAMSHGVPCIVTKNAGVSEIIFNNKNGIIFDDTEDDSSLIDTLNYVINSNSTLGVLNNGILNRDFPWDFESHFIKFIKILS
jgi:glycosyltransferase involved in cell wall biosynthesis